MNLPIRIVIVQCEDEFWIATAVQDLEPGASRVITTGAGNNALAAFEDMQKEIKAYLTKL